MARKPKVITTDAEIDAALKRARHFAPDDRRVRRAAYDQVRDEVCLRMTNGVTVLIPRKYLQGLERARPSELSAIELLGGGTGLHWPKLDVDHYVAGLLSNVFGTKQWMAQLGHLGGMSRSEAKKAASRANGLKGGRPASGVENRKGTSGKSKHGSLQIEKRRKTA